MAIARTRNGRMHFRFSIAAGRILAAAACLTTLPAGGAFAADPSVRAKDIGGGFYVWIDGAYERVALPAFTLGPGINVGAFPAYAGQMLSLNSDVDGYNLSGGIGYRLPGNWPGANTRIELGGRYAAASGSASQVTPYNMPDGFTSQ